jgi:hypothetical protein
MASFGDDREDEDRRAILARRNRLIAAALASVAATGCYESHTADAGTPAPCLRVDAGRPDPCLGAPLDAGDPMPCLSRVFDAGDPTPCLTIKPVEDGGPKPGPCLGAPFDAG